jgi:hypothetical protein
MRLPEIYGDFHKLDDENRICLTTVGSRRDFAALNIEPRDGLRVTIYMDDADDAGNPDDLMADAVIRYNKKEKCWVAEIDWSKVQNRSERTAHKREKTNDSPGKKSNGAPRSSRARKERVK